MSPANLAPYIDLPVMIIHGEKDQNFPLNHAWRLRDVFPLVGPYYLLPRTPIIAAQV